MKKEFIPYEQALALKELGFDEPCLSFYFKEEFVDMKAVHSFKEDSECLKAPLYQQVFRWFREKYGLYGFIDKTRNGRDISLLNLQERKFR